MADFPEEPQTDKSTETSASELGPKVDDACPAWADRLIRQLLALEVRLGNIRMAGPDAKWLSTELDDVLKRLDPEEHPEGSDAATSESLFRKIARGLAAHGFDAEHIAEFVNARLTPGARLRYCNAAEVKEVLLDA